MERTKNIFRDQRIINPTTSDGPFMGSNGRRRMLIISCPAPVDTPYTSDNSLANNVSTATLGIKLTYTVPAGVQATLTSATVAADVGTGVVSNLQLVRGAQTYNLAQYTTQGQFLGNLPLQAGDVIQWFVLTPIAASSSDFTINVQRNVVPGYVSVSFKGPAVLGEGLNLYAGGTPVILLPEDVAQGVREEIRCIASIAGLSVAVVELSYG